MVKWFQVKWKGVRLECSILFQTSGFAYARAFDPAVDRASSKGTVTVTLCDVGMMVAHIHQQRQADVSTPNDTQQCCPIFFMMYPFQTCELMDDRARQDASQSTDKDGANGNPCSQTDLVPTTWFAHQPGTVSSYRHSMSTGSRCKG